VSSTARVRTSRKTGVANRQLKTFRDWAMLILYDTTQIGAAAEYEFWIQVFGIDPRYCGA
jgi:hypothetical protein